VEGRSKRSIIAPTSVLEREEVPGVGLEEGPAWFATPVEVEAGGDDAGVEAGAGGGDADRNRDLRGRLDTPCKTVLGVPLPCQRLLVDSCWCLQYNLKVRCGDCEGSALRLDVGVIDAAPGLVEGIGVLDRLHDDLPPLVANQVS